MRLSSVQSGPKTISHEVRTVKQLKFSKEIFFTLLMRKNSFRVFSK